MEPEYLYNRLTVHFLEQLQNQKISSKVRKSIQPYMRRLYGMVWEGNRDL